MTKPNIKLFADERISVLPIPKSPKGNKYAVTSYGRIISFTTRPEEGVFLKQGKVSGYPSFGCYVRGGTKTFLTHRLVAKYFLRQPDRTYKFVIHLNNKKEDNHYKNLKWANFEQSRKHMTLARREQGAGNYKLTAAKVMRIKKMLAEGKTQLKSIAERYGVTDMQIYRIKTGENWSHVKI